MFDSIPPNTKEHHLAYVDKSVKMKVKVKLQRVLDWGYVKMDDIQFFESLMYMFHVPKGKDDIQKWCTTEQNLG